MAISKIDILVQRLNSLPKVMPNLIAKEIKELASVIEDLNTAQLQKGLRADGSTLPNYSAVSVAHYGKPSGPMKLKDTGAFYKGMTVKVAADSFEIDDADWKDAKLETMYGPVKGLNQESLNELRQDYLKIELARRIKNYVINGVQ